MSSIHFNNTFDPDEFGRVMVIHGGYSNERDVSLESGAAILSALKIIQLTLLGGIQGMNHLLATLKKA